MLIALLATFLIYFPGLNGPLVLDDNINLKAVSDYLSGDKTGFAVITDNRSGRLGRPVSMASYVLDAKLWGDSTWHAKRTNLLIHLATGTVVLLLFWLLLRRTPQLYRHAGKISLLLGATWLLLPIHVSTVLYLIQRMAQLSSFFLLAGLCLFVLAREAINRDQRLGTIALWTGVPILTAIAAFSKENGLLLPLMALVIELVWFRPNDRQKRPRSIIAFFLILVAIPAVVGTFLALTRPDSLFAGYAIRDYSIYERLLTQARVLWEYVFATLVPRPSDLGLFHDPYPISTGVLAPITTLLAILAWISVLALAWRWRVRIPAFAGGIGLFLAAHAMESGIFPLEIYFEHRNYLASVGLLLATAGLIAELAIRDPAPSQAFRIAGVALLFSVPVVFGMTTLNRVQAWSTIDSFYDQQLRHHPDSPRLHSYLLGFALNRADFFSAMTHIDAAERAFNRPNMLAPTYWRFLAYCAIDEPPQDSLYGELEAKSPRRIHNVDMMSWEMFAQKIEAGNCPGVDVERLATAAQHWLDKSEQPPHLINVWRSRYSLARLLATRGQLEEAESVARRTWEDSNYNRGVGIFLFQLNASLGNEEQCREILEQLEQSEGKGDLRFDRAVKRFRQALEAGLNESPVKNSEQITEDYGLM